MALVLGDTLFEIHSSLKFHSKFYGLDKCFLARADNSELKGQEVSFFSWPGLETSTKLMQMGRSVKK